NQKGISTGSQDKVQWMRKIEKITKKLGVPMFVLAATKENAYRKPETGMWDYFSCKLNQFKTIDKSESVYVGDAAGRDEDYSDSDRKFADNVGIAFQTPKCWGKDSVFPFPFHSGGC
ncbi:MAG: HAD-IIIA family hydrolase, partial [Ekhidna sp.]|nr:HAD-IIIA family hydrolase [Ekhidna sp.]